MVPTALRSGPSLTLGVLKEPPRVSCTPPAIGGKVAVDRRWEHNYRGVSVSPAGDLRCGTRVSRLVAMRRALDGFGGGHSGAECR